MNISDFYNDDFKSRAKLKNRADVTAKDGRKRELDNTIKGRTTYLIFLIDLREKQEIIAGMCTTLSKRKY